MMTLFPPAVGYDRPQGATDREWTRRGGPNVTAFGGMPSSATSSVESSRRTSAPNVDLSLPLTSLVLLVSGFAGSIVFIALGTYRRQVITLRTLRSRGYWYRIQVTGLILFPWFVAAPVLRFPALVAGQVYAWVAFIAGTAVAGSWLPLIPVRQKFSPGSLRWTLASMPSD
jgi:hypothetical protein